MKYNFLTRGYERRTWGKMERNKPRNLSKKMLASCMNCSPWVIAFWTARSCSIVLIGGGAITLTSSTGLPRLKYRVITVKVERNISINATAYPSQPLQFRPSNIYYQMKESQWIHIITLSCEPFSSTLSFQSIPKISASW